VRTNVAFLLNVVRHPSFVSGDLHTGFVDEHLAALLDTPPPSELVRAAAAFVSGKTSPAAKATGAPSPLAPVTAAPKSHDPWDTLTEWGRR
jgi:acetyl/propionyl-CoA carboxylase alpha subunit